MRNIVVLGCATLLAIGLSFSSYAGSITDADSDGIPDVYDNCDIANGPLASTDACVTQIDADLDGYGNPCDQDVVPTGSGSNGNGDGNILANDIVRVMSSFGNFASCPECDVTCDGNILANDIVNVMSKFGQNPGPSSLACAGGVGAAPCYAQ